MYALDTNTVIYFFKGAGEVAKNLLSKKMKEIFLPTVVAYEIQLGLLKSGSPTKQRQWEEFLDSCHLIPLGKKEGWTSAHIRFDLEKRGEPIGPMDTLIAGTAVAHGLVLVTHNRREFGKVRGLKLEDWY